MSWSHYVDGLTFGPAVVGEHNTLLTEHSATGTAFQCFVGGPDCHAPGSIMGGLSVDVAALVAARPDADYWAFFVNGFGAGGFSFGEDGCSGPACGPILLYRTFITIDGSYVSARTGVSVPADLENVPGAPITIGETEIDPDSDELALVLRTGQRRPVVAGPGPGRQHVRRDPLHARRGTQRDQLG